MSDPSEPALVLASASPRRTELLGRLGLAFDVRAVDLDEQAYPHETPDALVRRLAVEKASAAAAREPRRDEVVVGADTVVTIDGHILGKPADDADAARMLHLLSGRSHRVLTAVAVVRGDRPPAVEVASTEVTFETLGDEDVAWYVATGEPADKAGAYGLQGAGAVLISGIVGSADNVIGLPLALTRRLLIRAGLDPLGPVSRRS